MLPSLARHTLACLSRCMLGHPVIMLPSLLHMLGWPAMIHCLSRCMLGLACFYSAFPAHMLGQSATMLACHNVSQPALPECHNANLQQFHMLGSLPQCWPANNVCSADLSPLDENPMMSCNSSAVTLVNHESCHCICDSGPKVLPV